MAYSKEQLKTKFLELVSLIKRDGIEELLNWLETTDFYTAPASTKFHGNFEGGLCLHSIYVAQFALYNLNYICKLKPELESMRESVLISALFHDVCKVNTYKIAEKWTKDKNNKWQSYIGYEVNDMFPMGHGEKSVYYISKFIDLTQEEVLAIRHHMSNSCGAASIPGMDKMAYDAAFEYPIVKLIIVADILATSIEETVDYKN